MEQFYVGYIFFSVSICALTYNVIKLLSMKYPQCNYHPFWYGFMSLILSFSIWLVWGVALVKFIIKHKKGIRVPNENGEIIEVSPERFKAEQKAKKYEGKSDKERKRMEKQEKKEIRECIITIPLAALFAWFAILFMFGLA